MRRNTRNEFSGFTIQLNGKDNKYGEQKEKTKDAAPEPPFLHSATPFLSSINSLFKGFEQAVIAVPKGRSDNITGLDLAAAHNTPSPPSASGVHVPEARLVIEGDADDPKHADPGARDIGWDAHLVAELLLVVFSELLQRGQGGARRAHEALDKGGAAADEAVDHIIEGRHFDARPIQQSGNDAEHGAKVLAVGVGQGGLQEAGWASSRPSRPRRRSLAAVMDGWILRSRNLPTYPKVKSFSPGDCKTRVGQTN
ncbi:hypothetical protein DFH09DRAFT_1271469 [Mycena vulgaris]|nr:hypothetical protein DFH09DRAFT_1271469 [Mycena vulgaris]